MKKTFSLLVCLLLCLILCANPVASALYETEIIGPVETASSIPAASPEPLSEPTMNLKTTPAVSSTEEPELRESEAGYDTPILLTDGTYENYAPQSESSADNHSIPNESDAANQEASEPSPKNTAFLAPVMAGLFVAVMILVIVLARRSKRS